MTAARLIHTGNAVADLVLEVPALPPRGGDVLARSAGRAAGGGVNVMAAAARQGLPVVYAGMLGTGPNGTLVRESLEADGVTLANPPLADLDTGLVIVLVDDGGERTFATIRGAEARLDASALRNADVTGDDWVYVTGYSLAHDANRAALLGWLPALPPHTRVVFDPGPLAHQLPATALAGVLSRMDWCSANLAEARALTGLDDPIAATAHLAASARAGAIVRCGADGCLMATNGEVARIPGMVVDAVDLNGAGDAHVGAFIAGLAHGLTPAQAARRANAAAALAVTQRGPATSPTSAEVDAFLSA